MITRHLKDLAVQVYGQETIVGSNGKNLVFSYYTKKVAGEEQSIICFGHGSLGKDENKALRNLFDWFLENDIEIEMAFLKKYFDLSTDLAKYCLAVEIVSHPLYPAQMMTLLRRKDWDVEWDFNFCDCFDE